jgi:hypothetical protein
MCNSKPVYEHDCISCEYLETVALTGKYSRGKDEHKYDIYICRGTGRYSPSIIARASDEPSDNYSWDLESMKRLPDYHPFNCSPALDQLYIEEISNG